MPANEQVPSVWTRPPRRRREQPALSRDQIVSEAIQLLDGAGVDALSMRRLGTRLGSVATAIYWHVANKDELVELVVDEVFGELDVPQLEDPTRWRTAVVRTAHSMRAMILRHPWMVSGFDRVGLTYLGPNMMRLSDRLLAMVEAGGFGLVEADQVTKTVVAYVLGMTSGEATMLARLERSGQSEQDWVESVWPTAEKAAQAYPRLRELYAIGSGSDPERSRDENFSYGLERLMDGLQARLDQPNGPTV